MDESTRCCSNLNWYGFFVRNSKSTQYIIRSEQSLDNINNNYRCLYLLLNWLEN
jgi:hypothetical protein